MRHLNGEVHQYKGFVRFSDLGAYWGRNRAENRVLPLLRRHFCDRYRNERFFLYDRTHQEALFYAEGRSAVRPLEHFQMAPPDEVEARYRLLWKRFYDTIAIRERENPRCRMTHMPKRYWGTMTEFQGKRISEREELPQPFQAPALQPGYLHLRHPQDPGSLFLGQSLEVAGEEWSSAPSPAADRWTPAGRSAPPCPSSGASVPSIPSRVRPSAVSRWRDSGVSVAISTWAISSGVRPEASESSLSTGSRPSSCRSRSRNGVKCLSLLPHGAPNFYRAVVPEKATNLPGDFGHGVGGEAGAVVKVESLHRLQKPQAPQLVQVLRVHAPAVIPPHHAPDQAVVLNHRLLAGIPVPSWAARSSSSVALILCPASGVPAACASPRWCPGPAWSGPPACP